MAFAVRAPLKLIVTPPSGLPSAPVTLPLIPAGAAVGAFGSSATTNGDTDDVRAQIVFDAKLLLTVRFTSPGSPCSIRNLVNVLKSVAAGIVMQVVTGAVNVAVVVMFNSGQPAQCTYGGGSVCCRRIHHRRRTRSRDRRVVHRRVAVVVRYTRPQARRLRLASPAPSPGTTRP